MTANSKEQRNKINRLAPALASQIAAGEVVERPAAVLRELLDNAIDAGASRIKIALQQGGAGKIQVSDNGSGMAKEDLEICHLPHATSKLFSIDDLQKITTLGFRGEALNSIAACAQLTIASTTTTQQHGWQIEINKQQAVVSPSSIAKGTIVSVCDLFFYLPARRKFLKRPASENQQCRLTLFDKAFPFPEIDFQLQIDNQNSLQLSSGSLLQRAQQIYPHLNSANLTRLTQREGDIELAVVVAPPQVEQRNRRMMQTFINRRRIVDDSLSQAIRIGFDGYMHSGVFPTCFAFFTLPPDRVDFNIHPAKREARFLDLAIMQKMLRRLLRNFCREFNNPVESAILPPNLLSSNNVKSLPIIKLNPTITPVDGQREKPASTAVVDRFGGQDSDNRATTSEPSNKIEFTWQSEVQRRNLLQQSLPQDQLVVTEQFTYLGQLMKLYLLFEYRQTLYIVDQHAAHERLLYQKMVRRGLPSVPLLLPQPLPTADRQQSESLAQRAALLRRVGIEIGQEDGNWQILGLPPGWQQLSEELVALILNGACTNEDLERKLFAGISCRSAIKAGELLERTAAQQLIEQVIEQQLLNCPHGRPVATSLTRKKLNQLLGRE